MAKISLTDITSGYLSTATYNANNTLIENAIEKQLSRDGTSPNTMSANLDINSNKVVNISDGTNNQDAVSLKQLNDASVVASTIAASAVTVADAGANYAASTAEAAFAELASTSSGEGAAIIGSEDTGGHFAGADVETQLQDIGANYFKKDTSEEATLSGGHPIYTLAETGQSADEGKWQFEANNAKCFLRAANDAEDSFGPVYTVERSGETPTDFLFGCKVSLADNTLDRPTLKDYAVKHNTIVSSSAVITFDFTTGNSFDVVLFENITSITISNPPTAGSFGEIIIKFIQNGTGNWTVGGWPASVLWPGGSAPTITTTATTGTDLITLKTHDAGSTYYGDSSQDYS